MQFERLPDPVTLAQALWPMVTFYGPQREMIMSVRDSAETYVVAGNELGKDFVTGCICAMFFLEPRVFFDEQYVADVERLTRGMPEHLRHTRRIVTTSVRDDHLDVLFNEIGKFFSLCVEPIDHVIMMTREVRFRIERDLPSGKTAANYIKGICAAKEAGFAGHHARYTLGIGDESSSLSNVVYEEYQGWAKRQLYFGNPRPCSNFFKTNYKRGDLLVSA